MKGRMKDTVPRVTTMRAYVQMCWASQTCYCIWLLLCNPLFLKVIIVLCVNLPKLWFPNVWSNPSLHATVKVVLEERNI